MATIKATNVTKYDTGGADNIVPDGFIKTVEKVWIDSYTITAAIPSTSSILIARLPAGAKVTDIIVHLPVLASVSGATNTCYCCTGASTDITTYFGTLGLSGDTQKTTFETVTAATLRLNATDTNKCQALAAATGVYIMLDPATTVTGGTIRSIVKYTT